MPAFFTHWLIAGKYLETMSAGKSDAAWLVSYLKIGSAKYKEAADEFKQNLSKKICAVKTKKDFKRLKKSGLDDLVSAFEKRIRAKKYRDNILCYSSYMLGACGPDFWTLPCGPAIKIPNNSLP